MGIKNLTEREWYAYIEDHGHKLRRDERGEVDYFVLEYEYHNGPGCERCGDTWCQHCRDEVERCEKPYTAELAFPPLSTTNRPLTADPSS